MGQHGIQSTFFEPIPPPVPPAHWDELGEQDWFITPIDSWSACFEFPVIPQISSDKLRINVTRDSDFINILAVEVYYVAAWHNIYLNVPVPDVWLEMPIPAGTKLIEKARVMFWNSDTEGTHEAKINDFEIWHIP